MKKLFITLAFCLVSVFNVSAQYNLKMGIATAMTEGKWEAAVKGLKTAVEMGDVPSMRILAKCYLDGRGVEKDLKKAAELLMMAAKNGDEQSKEILKNLIGDVNDSAKKGNEEAQNVINKLKKDSTPSSVNSNTPSTSKVDNHEWVDLGLSVKWATCNEGATEPSDYGTHYKWNDISSSWRLPTVEELRELKSKCDWTWTSKNGHGGYIVTGPSGKSIFLPAAGYREADVNYEGSKGYYWSSTLDKEAGSVSTIMFDSNYVNHSGSYPSTRLSVRAVCP